MSGQTVTAYRASEKRCCTTSKWGEHVPTSRCGPWSSSVSPLTTNTRFLPTHCPPSPTLVLTLNVAAEAMQPCGSENRYFRCLRSLWTCQRTSSTTRYVCQSCRRVACVVRAPGAPRAPWELRCLYERRNSGVCLNRAESLFSVDHETCGHHATVVLPAADWASRRQNPGHRGPHRVRNV